MSSEPNEDSSSKMTSKTHCENGIKIREGKTSWGSYEEHWNSKGELIKRIDTYPDRTRFMLEYPDDRDNGTMKTTKWKNDTIIHVSIRNKPLGCINLYKYHPDGTTSETVRNTNGCVTTTFRDKDGTVYKVLDNGDIDTNHEVKNPNGTTTQIERTWPWITLTRRDKHGCLIKSTETKNGEIVREEVQNPDGTITETTYSDGTETVRVNGFHGKTIKTGSD